MPRAGDPAEVDRLVAVLRDPRNAVAARAFPSDVAAAKYPGVYACWTDRIGSDMLADALSLPLTPLIYAGIAGATRCPSGKPSDTTLLQRVGGLHLHGNIRGSTFRLTLAAILRGPLQLQVAAPGRLATESEQELSAWMARHLLVTVHPYLDRDRLGAMERAILDRLAPPLNLAKTAPTPLRARLRALRRAIGQPR